MSNDHGLPDYGNIQNRASKYNKNETFVDPSGKSPIAFAKIMKKLKLTEEQVREEALIQGVKIDPRHFELETKKSGRPKQVKPEKDEKVVKAKGRPKKSKKVLELAGEEEDLFASLVMSANTVSSVSSVSSVTNVEEIMETTTEEVVENDSSLGDVDVVVSANKKIKEKKVKEPKVKETKVKEPKVKETAEEKEQKKKELAQQKEAEKEQKKKELAQQKEQKKKELAQQKEAEKEQKKKELLAKQNEKKKPTKETKKVKDDDDVRPTPVFIDPPVDEEADVVKKIIFEGKKYLKSKKSGIIYNMEQDVIGKWNEEKQRIDFNEEGEESEEEYDEDE